MRSLSLALAIPILTVTVLACHAQPPPPQPASSRISEEALAKLANELGTEPIIAFAPNIWPGGGCILPAGGVPRWKTELEGRRTKPEEQKIKLEDGTVLYLKDAVRGQKYVTENGSVVSVYRSTSGHAGTLVRYGLISYHPLVMGLLLNKNDYRLATVVTTTPAAFNSLVSLHGLRELFCRSHEGAFVQRQLGMADYPQQNLGEFEMVVTRKDALARKTVTFIAWRSPREIGQPQDEDSEILATPVGQVVLNDGVEVLKGGLR